MFSIGEFSVVTKLSVKTLRFYHEQGILVPDHVDEATSYRYYGERSIARAEAIKLLREMGFGIGEISEIFSGHHDDADLVPALEKKRDEIRAQIAQLGGALEKIEFGLETTARGERVRPSFTVAEKEVGDILFAGHRYKGKYQDIGKALGLVSAAMGRRICGPAMSLDYEGEYKEDDADIEAGFPVAKKLSSPDVDVRELKGGKAVTVTHRGPHETIGRSYELVFKHIHEKGYTTLVPCRVLYHKGPGTIFRGNPEKYVTEIQIFVE
jgi:DNA-binding transcriptional MerR regulator/effector-binding domain-containing protein